MRARIEVDGERELRRALRRVSADAVDDMRPVHIAAADVVLEDALTRVPVRTGTLRDTLRSTGGRTRGYVRAGYARVPYAGPIHFGWPRRNIRPNTFLYDAADHRAPEVVAAYEKGVQGIIERRGLEVR